MRSLRCRTAVLLLMAAGSLMIPLRSDAGASRISAQAVEGWVVDGAGKPVPDVAVMAHWTLEGSVIGPTTRELTILETTTDTSGHYRIPAWGPKDVSFPLYMLSNDPVIHFFKSGYQFATKRNTANASRAREDSEMRTSEWNGKPIVLEQLPDTAEIVARQLDAEYVDIIVRMTESKGSCNWKLMPQFLKRLNNERLQLEARLGKPTLLPRPQYFADQARCGSAEEFLMESPK